VFITSIAGMLLCASGGRIIRTGRVRSGFTPIDEHTGD
jgi:hypothetical protein